MYNNTPSNATVNGASNISHRLLIQADVTGNCYRPLLEATDTGHCYRPMLQANVFAVLIINMLKNLTNVVIGKLSKLVYKQNNLFIFYKV